MDFNLSRTSTNRSLTDDIFAVTDSNHHQHHHQHQQQPRTSKICGVCGDVARCYHFGGLCCASCKAFFRRAVVNDRYKQYRCVYGGSCRIDIISRKHCSHCRLKRCLAIGMDKKWFMSDEMRAELKMKSMKRMRNNQQQLMMLTQKLCQQLRPMDLNIMAPGYLSPHQMKEIESLVHLCKKAYNENLMPNEVAGNSCHEKMGSMGVIFTVVIQRCFSFLSSIPQLKRLDIVNRMSLLRQHGMESLIVLSALTFDPINKGWPSTKPLEGSTIREPVGIHVCEADFTRLHGPAVMRKHFDTVTSLLSLNPDEPMIVLLSLIAFFTVDDETFSGSIRNSGSSGSSSMSSNSSCSGDGSSQILAIQEHFIDLLKRYAQWKMGPAVSEKMFARFILKLSDVREVNNLHQVAQLRLSGDEIHQVEDLLGGLGLVNGKSNDNIVVASAGH